MSEGLDSVTVVSTDGSFGDVSLHWTLGSSGRNPGWRGTLETEGLAAGTYGYEVRVSDRSQGRFDVGVAAAQFSIIEAPSSS